MLCQKRQKRSITFKNTIRFALTLLILTTSSWLLATPAPTREDCLREMDYWSSFIGLIVAGHQASGTAFLYNQFWPAVWPDDCLNINPGQTLKLYFRPWTNETRFSNELPPNNSLVIKDYLFSHHVFFIHGLPTQTMRLYCYAFEKADRIEYWTTRLEFTLQSMDEKVVIPYLASPALWLSR